MELRILKTFVTTAKLLSFTKAANDLGYAQSTVTNQIQALEEELGTMVFERLGKQIKLTKDGEHLYAYAAQILKLSDEAKDLISSSLTPKGSKGEYVNPLPILERIPQDRYTSWSINLPPLFFSA